MDNSTIAKNLFQPTTSTQVLLIKDHEIYIRLGTYGNDHRLDEVVVTEQGSGGLVVREFITLLLIKTMQCFKNQAN